MAVIDCTAPDEISTKPINKFDSPYIEYHPTPVHLESTLSLDFNNKTGEVKIYRGDYMAKDKPHIQPYQAFAKKEQDSNQEFIISKEIMELLTKQIQGKESYSLGEYTLVKTTTFNRLKSLDYKVDEIIDEIMYETTMERKDDVADIPLSDVMNELNIDISSIEELMDTIEEDF